MEETILRHATRQRLTPTECMLARGTVTFMALPTVLLGTFFPTITHAQAWVYSDESVYELA